jgi:hypothetical protein
MERSVELPVVYKARCLYISLLYIQTMYRYAKYVHYVVTLTTNLNLMRIKNHQKSCFRPVLFNRFHLSLILTLRLLSSLLRNKFL